MRSMCDCDKFHNYFCRVCVFGIAHESGNANSRNVNNINQLWNSTYKTKFKQ